MTLLVVRHAETEWNALGKLQGRLDSPLTERGRTQARRQGHLLRTLLPPGVPVRCCCSPLGRALATTQIFAECLGLSADCFDVDSALSELDYGDWSGLTLEEVERRFPGELAVRKATHWRYRVPGGESDADAAERARRWLDTLRRGRFTVVVTHEMMSRCLQREVLGWDEVTALAQKHPHDTVVELANGQRVAHRACPDHDTDGA
ncbi:MAG: histidine phosphatase family protein [Pseudomonadota bacterium]